MPSLAKPTSAEVFNTPIRGGGIRPLIPSIGTTGPFARKSLRLLPSTSGEYHTFLASHSYASFEGYSFPSRKSQENLMSPIHSFGHEKSNVHRVECVNKMKSAAAIRKKLAVFVSGGGSNFKSIHQACREGVIHGDVVVIVTNNSECGGAQYARKEEIPVLLFPKSGKNLDGVSPGDLVFSLRRLEVDYILLAGYLKLLPFELIHAYPRAIVNIHPSLLPAFGGKGYYGMKVHKAVISAGARYSGPTIHFVDEEYDTGRILAQRVVPVHANDTHEELAARVLKEEHRLYIEVAAALCDDRIFWREDGVPLIRSADNPEEFW